MSETNLWKIVERLEDITENLFDINDYLEQVHEQHIAYSNWIQVATDSIMKLQKDITFLKNKRICI